MSRWEERQPARLMCLVFYLGVLLGLNRAGFGQWVPLANEKGLWFYSGMLFLVLGSLLVTPFFTSPANALSYGATILVVVRTCPVDGTSGLGLVPYYLLACYASSIVMSSALAIVLKDLRGQRSQRLSKSCAVLADTVGSPRAAFGMVVLYAIIEYHRDSPVEASTVAVAALVVASNRPVEQLIHAASRLTDIWRAGASPDAVGLVAAHQSPDIVLVRQDEPKAVEPGSCLLIADRHAPSRLAVALGYRGRDEGLLLRCLTVDPPSSAVTELRRLSQAVPEGTAVLVDREHVSGIDSGARILRDYGAFVGTVASDSSVRRLFFEVAEQRDVGRGRLVETMVGRRAVLYQVLDGVTRDETVRQKSRYGYVRGQATQIGEWNADEMKFMPCDWVPQINAPVYLRSMARPPSHAASIGHFPGTDFTVSLRSVHDLVTHNAAIMGILGIGKSMLAMELIERMIAERIKVVCLDLTNQYLEELAAFVDQGWVDEYTRQIHEAGQVGREDWAETPGQGGSLSHLRRALRDDLRSFMADNSRLLKVYNPAAITATRQKREPGSFTVDGEWQRGATLWTVTPVEITQIIAEALLSLVQGQMSERAKVCLVLEEAHSLVPEWSSVTVDGDRRAMAGAARAIIQGRKYGLGCLLVTQRTANVTKTILNQCNTVFAMRTFDDTGRTFLSNYLGSAYASMLSSLCERHAVVFGKASSCESPVLIRLNDREDFIATFRAEHPIPGDNGTPPGEGSSPA